jgi:gliding motility-associated-like protein
MIHDRLKLAHAIPFTSLKALPLVVLIAVAGWCLLPTQATGNHTGAIAQTPNDSIEVPNVFTPNGDGANDVFEVTSKERNSVSLKIFTRAGVLVFSIQAKHCRWDGNSLSGQAMATGVYYYTAEVTGSSPKVKRAGFIHLYR